MEENQGGIKEFNFKERGVHNQVTARRADATTVGNLGTPRELATIQRWKFVAAIVAEGRGT